MVTILHRKPYKKERYLLEFRNKFNKHFKFVFVRNPWAWQASLYFHFRQSWQNPNRQLFKDTFKSFEDWMVNREKHNSAEYFGGSFIWELDVYNQICYYNNEFLPDYVAKVETMEDDIRRIFAMNKIKIIKFVADFRDESRSKDFIVNKRKSKNNVLNTNKHEYYSKYYTDELIDLVYRNNREIIEKYDYEFEGRRNA